MENENGVRSELREHECETQTGIQRAEEFEKKGLAMYAANVGPACGHQCLYCSTRSLMFRHKSFKECGEKPMELGYAITDTGIVERVRRDAKKYEGKRGRVMVCSYSDGWSPQAQKYNLGPQIVEAILAEQDWTVRILTKNSAVEGCYDALRQNSDRVLVGLTTNFLPEHDSIARVVEPYASSPTERYESLVKARRAGLQTYGMLCPLLPGLFDTQDAVDRLIQEVLRCEPTEIFAENLNARGNNMLLTSRVLRENGLGDLADKVDAVRHDPQFSLYVRDLSMRLLDAADRLYDLNRFRLMMYDDNLLPEHKGEFLEMEGIVWLHRG